MFPLLLALACVRAPPATPPPDPGETPLLPAPEGDLYVAVQGTPRDGLVARVAAGLPWDEALSGAAGSLALDGDPTADLGRARWAAWRAGYPYPLQAMVLSAAAVGEPPADLRAALESALRPGDALGLARARLGEEERWVGLIARPVAQVGVIPRAVGVGEALPLAGPAGLRYALVSPSGRLRSGALPAEPRLDEAGEWWLEIRDAAGELALSLPAYAGVPPAPDAPLELPGDRAAGPDNAAQQTLALIEHLRAAFDQPSLDTDPTLALLAGGSAAGLTLGAQGPGAWDREAEELRLNRAGFPSSPRQLRCAEATVALCLDSLMRAPADRAALLSGGVHLIGVGASVSTQGLGLVINLAAE